MKTYLIKLLALASIGSLISCASTTVTYTNPAEFLPSYAIQAGNEGSVLYEYKTFFPELTPLQLKTMQTRKFNKSQAEIYDGIKEMCGNSNGTFRPTGDGLSCNFPVNKSFFIMGSEDQNKYFFVKYFYEAKEQETIIRIRMYGSAKKHGLGGTAQFTIDSLYQAQFKKIADSLFINAIPLSPQEMN